jgi:hypothetical protein
MSDPKRCDACGFWNRERAFPATRDGKRYTVAACLARPPRTTEQDGRLHTVWPTVREDQWCGGWRGLPSVKDAEKPPAPDAWTGAQARAESEWR